jgi:hypothetical protein
MFEMLLFINHLITWHFVIRGTAEAIKQTMLNVEGQFNQQIQFMQCLPNVIMRFMLLLAGSLE